MYITQVLSLMALEKPSNEFQATEDVLYHGFVSMFRQKASSKQERNQEYFSGRNVGAIFSFSFGGTRMIEPPVTEA